MSTLINRVKDHIQDNRGKYGGAAGIGLAYGASQLPSTTEISPLINQAGFNILAKGQNLALDTADKIGYGKEQLQNMGLQNKIRPEDIDAHNELYNSKIGQMINPGPINMVNSAENNSELYAKVQDLKNRTQDGIDNLKNQGHNYIDSGVNYLKGLNPFNESTNLNLSKGNTLKIQIKKALLEGHQPEEIVEAVHAGTIYEKGRALGNMNRPGLAQSIKDSRTQRDIRSNWSKKGIGDAKEVADGNYFDNEARIKSQISKETLNRKDLPHAAATQQPRLYQAAKK